MFQFQNGTIKSFAVYKWLAINESFNSKMVRLKVFSAFRGFYSHYGFNSKMVRLKGPFLAATIIAAGLFQFQNGAIKSSI